MNKPKTATVYINFAATNSLDWLLQKLMKTHPSCAAVHWMSRFNNRLPLTTNNDSRITEPSNGSTSVFYKTTIWIFTKKLVYYWEYKINKWNLNEILFERIQSRHCCFMICIKNILKSFQTQLFSPSDSQKLLKHSLLQQDNCKVA